MSGTPNKKPVDVNQLIHEDRKKRAKETYVSEEFVIEHMSMVEAIASKIVRSGKKPSSIEFEDLVSWGVEGLIKAHQNFKDDKGSTFKTYAYYRIHGEMYDRIRQEWQYRNPNDYNAYRQQIQDRIAEVIEGGIESEEQSDEAISPSFGSDLISSAAMSCLMSIDNIAETLGVEDPTMSLVDDGIITLREEIDQLDDEEKLLIDLFYHEDMSQKDIADKMNKSRSKICRMHMKVLEKLRRRLSRKED